MKSFTFQRHTTSQHILIHLIMTSKTTPLTPPTLVRIVRSAYDSDNEEESPLHLTTSPNSFVHPLSEAKKARARGGSKKITFLDEISWNAVGIGQSMAVQANHSLQRLVAPEIDDEDIEGYESNDDSQHPPSKLDKLMGMALDRADMYATALCNVTDRVPVPSIGNGFICGDDEYSEESWSSHEEDRPRRERYNRTKKNRRPKKKASSAIPYNGHLSDSLSISSDDVSYTFEDPTILSPKQTRVTTSTHCPKAASLRQRREEFMRRKDSSIETTTHSRSSNIKRPEIIKLRAKHFYSQPGNFEHDRSDDECDKLYGESIPDLVDSYSNDSGEKSYKYKWQSNSATVVIPVCDSIFFMSTHLGPSILRVPPEMGNSVQMGDIMLRVDGEDVSSAEVSVLENVLKSMRGKKVQVSFLRKRMSA